MIRTTPPNSQQSFLASPHAISAALFAGANTFVWAAVGNTISPENAKASGIALGALFGGEIGTLSFALKYLSYKSSIDNSHRKKVAILTTIEGGILGFGLVIALFGPFENKTIGNTAMLAGMVFGAIGSYLINKYGPSCGEEVQERDSLIEHLL